MQYNTFYKQGKAPELKELTRHFQLMSARFYERLKGFGEAPGGCDLSVKMIVHYGSFSVYKINGFTKLYGTPVIEAHRLLKNSVNAGHYLLVSQSYLDSVDAPSEGIGYGAISCEQYDIGNISYRYFTDV